MLAWCPVGLGHWHTVNPGGQALPPGSGLFTCRGRNWPLARSRGEPQSHSVRRHGMQHQELLMWTLAAMLCAPTWHCLCSLSGFLKVVCSFKPCRELWMVQEKLCSPWPCLWGTKAGKEELRCSKQSATTAPFFLRKHLQSKMSLDNSCSGGQGNQPCSSLNPQH